jgi:hypothetical protein
MSTSTVTINVSAQRATFAALVAALVKGINTDLAGVDSFVIDGSRLARADLLARFQQTLDAIAAVKAARTALFQAVASQKTTLAQARALRGGVKRFLQTQLGPQNPKLQDFGFTPARVAKTLVTTKAQAKVKATATRAARGTKGRKQKAAIKGDATALPAKSGTAAAPPATPPAAATPSAKAGASPS